MRCVLNDKGVFSRRNPETGERSYQSRVAPGASALTASPWAGKVFAMSEEGDTFVIEAAGHESRLVHKSFDDFSMATPTIVGDRLLIETRRPALFDS